MDKKIEFDSVDEKRNAEIRKRVEFFEQNSASIKSDFSGSDKIAVAVVSVASFAMLVIGFFI